MGRFRLRGVLAVGVSFCALLGSATDSSAADQAITGKKLLLKSTPKLVLLSKDPSITFAGSNPVTGADSSISFDDGTTTTTFSLPAGSWSANGASTLFKYKNVLAPGGPSAVKIVKLKSGLLKVIAKGLPFAVPNGAATITVVLSLDGGTNSLCMTFSGTGDGSKFLVKDAPAASCPGGAATPTPTGTATPTPTVPSCAPVMVKDINPGTTGAFPTFFGILPLYGGLTRLNEALLFQADDGSSGFELWRTDGTNAGTQRIKDINPGAAGSSPIQFKPFNGELIFVADDGSSGSELWKTDGTAAGTVQIKDINPGPGSSLLSYREFIEFNNALYFGADDGLNGYELWKTDGTTAGTVLVKDVYPGSTGSNIKELTVSNGTLFFLGFHPSEQALWKSDGTGANTVAIIDLDYTAGGCSDSQEFLHAANGTVYLANNNTFVFPNCELWKSDGTVGGTMLVKELDTSSSGSLGNPNVDAVNIDATFYFMGYGGSSAPSGLYRTEGTAATTVHLKEVSVHTLIVVGGRILFTGTDSASYAELWVSDGTVPGTMLVKDILPGIDPSTPSYLANVNGTLVFSADDGVQGRELWKSDGTASGTVLVADINPGANESFPLEFVDLDGTLLFHANDGVHGDELWVLPCGP